jgi:hypothetical protein
MYKWYANAKLCMAFLDDVLDGDDPRRETGSCFLRSKWFTRGWTLQKLVAPRNVLFLSQGWRSLETKPGMASTIKVKTGINLDVLCYRRSPSELSVTRRMSFAHRTTTHAEDRAYVLR